MKFAVILLVQAGLMTPIVFFSVGLPALMRAAGLPLALIGLTALIYLPSILAFLWAPIVDLRSLGPLGRRRSWMIAAPFGMAALLVACAPFAPGSDIAWVLAIALAVALLASTGRTALLGFMVESLGKDQRPWGGALLPAGGALGTLIGSGGLLLLYDRVGWSSTMIVMASLVSLLVLPVLLAAEPQPQEKPRPASWSPSLQRFFRRAESRPVLVFLTPLAVGLGLGFGMLQPRLVDLGFGLDDIGLINGLFSCAALFTGGPLAAVLFRNAGMALVLPLGVGLLVVDLLYLGVAGLWGLSAIHGALAVVLFYLAFSFISVVTNTIFMAHCAAGQEGTDFTIFLCLYLLLSMIGMMLSGVLAQFFGYPGVFLLAAGVTSTSLLFASRMQFSREAGSVTA